MSTVTCNEDMKSKAINSRFEPTFGVLEGNAQGSFTLDGKRIAGFLLVIIELFSLALTADRGSIKRNLSQSSFSEGVGHFERKV